MLEKNAYGPVAYDKIVRVGDLTYPDNGVSISGMAYQMKGQPRQAQRHFVETIRLSPKLGPAYTSLAWILGRQGKADQAEQVYRKGIEAVPDDASLHLNLGLLLRGKGQFKEADKELQKAIELDPNVAMQLRQAGMGLH
jgi:Tfp pilus assembly protein PilF